MAGWGGNREEHGVEHATRARHTGVVDLQYHQSNNQYHAEMRSN